MTPLEYRVVLAAWILLAGVAIGVIAEIVYAYWRLLG